MRTLALIVYILIAVVLAVFAVRNWDPVTLRLWSGLELYTRVPVLIAVSVLLGALPGWITHAVERFRLKRRVSKLERELAAKTPAPSVDPLASAPVMPQAQPMIVPPANA